jgi:formylglycine-generating enzyme required for sulfatase activity
LDGLVLAMLAVDREKRPRDAAEVLARLKDCSTPKAPPLPEPKRAGPAIHVAERPPRAGATKVNPTDGLTYVWIAPGTFQMGCSPGDGECYDDEKPAHHVTITRGYWMGQTAVTQEAYERVTGKNPSRFKGARLPVENVNWEEARSYCEAVGMRLPTEAEWEYAARAGATGSRYGELDRIAWYDGNSGGKTHPVGEKEPNAWGLYDVLGNVWEWVSDWDANYQAGSQNDPAGPASGKQRVLRGGSWYNYARNARASLRNGVEPEYRNDNIGLRCVGN